VPGREQIHASSQYESRIGEDRARAGGHSIPIERRHRLPSSVERGPIESEPCLDERTDSIRRPQVHFGHERRRKCHSRVLAIQPHCDWSDSEQTRLTEALLDAGSDALLDALRDTPRVGYLRMSNSLGYDLHFARALPGDDGGRRIVLATDRPILFWEARNHPRSIDYPFTVIELRLNRDGEGEGKMSIAARISGNNALNLIELEDYANQPVRLLGVRSDRRPT
jgi:hypothetical protein